jgi:hypothetical protein
VTCGLLRLLIHDPISLYAEIRSEKIALAHQWAGVVSVAAFGTSHVDCGFDPRSFDAILAPGTTHPISLNLGVSGGSQIEQTAVAREFERQIDNAKAATGDHVFFMEANGGVNFIPKFMTHPRSINIYDSTALRLALSFSDWRLGKLRALGRSLVAFADYGLNFMNVGMLSSEIFPAPMNSELIKTQTEEDRRGLTPPPPSPHDAKDTADIRALVASLRAPPTSSPAVITPGLCAEAKSLTRQGRNNDYQVVYFVTPKLTDLRAFDVYPESIRCGDHVIPIINVALPAAHPELYDISLWHDINHLNERGAGLYSTLLAQAYRAGLDKQSMGLRFGNSSVIH